MLELLKQEFSQQFKLNLFVHRRQSCSSDLNQFVWVERVFYFLQLKTWDDFTFRKQSRREKQVDWVRQKVSRIFCSYLQSKTFANMTLVRTSVFFIFGGHRMTTAAVICGGGGGLSDVISFVTYCSYFLFFLAPNEMFQNYFLQNNISANISANI